MTEEARKLAREEVARIIDPIAFSALTTRPPRKTLQKMAFEKADAILALTPSHEAGTQDARVPKVRTNHHRNKEEAARLQALVTERYARDGAGTQEPVADWQLVPVEPTLEMLKVGYAALKLFVPDDETPIGQFRIYEAMLEAAPAAPASQDATREITDAELSDWARKWHWADCERESFDHTIYPRDLRMLKAFIASPARADDGEKAAFLNKFCQSNGEEA